MRCLNKTIASAKGHLPRLIKFPAYIVVLATSFFFLSSSNKNSALQPGRLNVVVIMTDDLADAGEFQVALNNGFLPNIQNRLVNQGTTFTNSFVSNSLCCPSRATFLSGQYTHNHRVRTNSAPKGGVTKFNDSSTLPVWLKQVGYRTGYVGKYLNEYGENLDPTSVKDDSTYIPPGWDDWQALVDPTTYGVYNYTINDNGVLVNYGLDLAEPPEEYQTHVLAYRAQDFINESEALNDQTPFFLVTAPMAPHNELDLPYHNTPECKLNYQSQKIIRPAPWYVGSASSLPLPQDPNYNEEDISDKPSWLQFYTPLTSAQIQCLQRVYQKKIESLRSVDDLVGTIISALESNGELEKTVIVFTSDNGYLLGEHRLHGKQLAYDKSSRVPLVIRRPTATTPTSTAGLVVNNDLAPTIAELAGAVPDIPVDGRSLLPLLQNPNLASWRKRILIEHFARENLEPGGNNVPAYSAVRALMGSENRLYVEYDHGSRELYNINNDPYQLVSRHNEFPQQVQNLSAILAQLKQCSGSTCKTWEDR
jgi:arylsulfatase A-like enzyme